MADRVRILRLYLLDDRSVDLDRVMGLVDRLSSVRAVRGEAPSWYVRYATEDVSVAMTTCAAELDGLDPDWREILDFTAVRRAGVA